MNPVEQRLAEIIRESGPLSCARFMETALYLPEAGYYERQREIGRQGDFYTSVSVGEVFGQLLAFAIARRLNPFPGPLRIVE
jgi:SAM-dependent MidA family methyltransferase